MDEARRPAVAHRRTAGDAGQGSGLTDTSEAAWPADAVPVGRIVDAWGIKGGFKVVPFSADPQALFSSRRWFLRPTEGPRPAACPSLLRITSARTHGDVVVAQAHDIDDRNAAEALKGATVHVARSSFPTPEADAFYWVDLIGLHVVNRDDVDLGNVDSLLETGAHSVLRVLQGEHERLIPFVAAYIDEVDLANRQIRVDWGIDF